jgi:hypothetical protein
MSNKEGAFELKDLVGGIIIPRLDSVTTESFSRWYKKLGQVLTVCKGAYPLDDLRGLSNKDRKGPMTALNLILDPLIVDPVAVSLWNGCEIFEDRLDVLSKWFESPEFGSMERKKADDLSQLPGQSIMDFVIQKNSLVKLAFPQIPDVDLIAKILEPGKILKESRLAIGFQKGEDLTKYTVLLDLVRDISLNSGQNSQFGQVSSIDDLQKKIDILERSLLEKTEDNVTLVAFIKKIGHKSIRGDKQSLR